MLRNAKKLVPEIAEKF